MKTKKIFNYKRWNLRYFYLVFIFSNLLSQASFSQQTGTQAWYIHFTDKANTVYSVERPLEFLSQRSIDRRLKNDVKTSPQDFPVNAWYVDSLRARGAKIMFTSRWFNSATIQVDTESVIKEIYKLSFVKSAERVFKKKNKGVESINQLSMITNHTTVGVAFDEYGTSLRQTAIHKGQLLHQEGANGHDVLIAVIDAGFILADSLEAFDYLNNNNRIVATHDFVDGDNNVFHSHSHGTIVLSVMGGRLYGKLIGTAPEASFLLLRSENAPVEYLVEEDAWVAAAEYADSAGADVINSSLGYSDFDNPAMNHSYADMDGNTTRITRAADLAAGKGILVVSSAGNEGLSKWHYISAPADGDSVLAVGAVDADLHYASFSSVGPSSDGRIKPNVMAMGVGTAATSLDGGFVSYFNGTSLSSPVIAGLSASLISAFPDRKMMEVKDAIEKSCNMYSRPNDSMGFGIPDYMLAYQILDKQYSPNTNDLEILQTFPNPFNSSGFTLSMISVNKSETHLAVYDNLGKMLYTRDLSFNPMEVKKIWINPGQFLQKGVYLLVVRNETTLLTRTLLKM